MLDLSTVGLLQDTIFNTGLATSSAALFPRKVVFSDGIYVVGGIEDVDDKVFVAKLDYTGHFQWASSIEHDSNQISDIVGVTASNRGGIYLSYYTFGQNTMRVGRFVEGAFDWIRELDPGGATTTVRNFTPNCLTRNGADDLLVAISADSFGQGIAVSLAAADGSTQFAREFAETAGAQVSVCCAARNRPSGGYYVGGILGESGYFLARFTEAGAFDTLLRFNAGTSSFAEGVRDVAVSASGDVYALLQYVGDELRLVKLNSSLVVQWSRSYSSDLVPQQVVAIDDDDSVVILGEGDTNRWFLKLASDGTAGTQRTMVMNSTAQGSALGSLNGNQILMVDSSSTTVEAAVIRGATDGSDLLLGNGLTWGTASLTQSTPSTATDTTFITDNSLTVTNTAETDTTVTNITTSEFLAPTRFGA